MEDKVLETVLEGLKYVPLKDILIKPLPTIKLTKEVTEAVGTGEKDIDGYEKFDTKTETKEGDSEGTEGIILTIPEYLHEDSNLGFKAGDTVVYNKKFAKEFDLFKDSVLVKSYDIVARKK